MPSHPTQFGSFNSSCQALIKVAYKYLPYENTGMKLFTYLLPIFITFLSISAHAKWDEEKGTEIKNGEPITYYSKVNADGHKLVLDKYVKRLIFIQKDKLFKRTINSIRIDGELIETYSDRFVHFPEQTAITFDNKDDVLKKLFRATKVDVNVTYNREGEKPSSFQIK